MINKNKFSIKDTKKVLHKVGKRWVVVSAVLLGLAAGGAAVTTANADTTNAQAAQPTAAQQVNKNANMSAANHSFGASDPANATKAPSTMKLGADNGNALNNLVNKAKNKVGSAKSHVETDVRTDSQYANVTNLTKLANNVKSGNASTKAAYANLASLASQVPSYENISLGSNPASNSDSNTAFGMFNQISNDINGLEPTVANTPKGQYFLNKLASGVTKVDSLANNGSVSSTFNSNINKPIQLMSKGSHSVKLSTPISGISSLNYRLNSDVNYTVNASVSAPVSFSAADIIDNGMDVQSSVNSIVNQLASSASNSVTSNAQSFAKSVASNNDVLGQVRTDLFNDVSSRFNNDVSNYVSAFGTAYSDANLYNATYSGVITRTTNSAVGYAQLKSATSKASDAVTRFTLASTVARTKGYAKSYAAQEALTKAKHALCKANRAQATTSEAASGALSNFGLKSNDSTSLLNKFNSNSAYDKSLIQSTINNSTVQKITDAGLLNKLNSKLPKGKSVNSSIITELQNDNTSSAVQNTVSSAMSSVLPKLPESLNPLVSTLQNMAITNTKPSNQDLDNTLHLLIDNEVTPQLINTKIDTKVATAVQNNISTLVTSNEKYLDTALETILGNNAGEISPLKNYNIHKLDGYLTQIKGNIKYALLALSTPVGNNISADQKQEYTTILKGLSKAITNVQDNYINKYTGYINDFFNTNSNAYDSLVATVSALPSDLTAPNAESKAYSAYKNIASYANTFLSDKNLPHYDAINRDVTNSIVNEANTSAYSMSSTSASMASVLSDASDAISNASSGTLKNIETSLLGSKNNTTISNLSNASAKYYDTLSGADTSVSGLDTDNIKFDYTVNGKNPSYLANLVAIKGLNGESFNATALSNLDSKTGYSLASPQTISFNGSNATSDVTVTLNSTSSATTKKNTFSGDIEFVNQVGSTVSNDPYSYEAASASDSNITAPNHYTFTNGDSTTSVSLTNGTQTVHVEGVSTTENVQFTGDPKDSGYSISGRYGDKEIVKAPNGYALQGDGSFILTGGNKSFNLTPVSSTPVTPVTPSHHNGGGTTPVTPVTPSHHNGGGTTPVTPVTPSHHNGGGTTPVTPVTPSHHNGGSNTPVTPSNNGGTTPSNSTNNNNMPFIPSVPTFNNGSMASTNASASAEPSSMSANANNSSAEPKARVANYVTVEKELQLHTSPNFTKKNRVMTVEPGTRLDLEKTVRARHGLVRYEVNYKGKSYFVTANKKFTAHLSYELAKPSHYRYFKVGKALQLHTSPYFTKKNGVMTVKPGAEFRINRVVKAHGFVRYEVSYKGSVYFVTANKAFSANAYLQKSNFRKHGRKSVRVIKNVSEYKKANFKKHSLIRNFRRGSVLPVKRVITIANGEMTRLQLTNGRYVTSNKDFVRVIK